METEKLKLIVDFLDFAKKLEIRLCKVDYPQSSDGEYMPLEQEELNKVIRNFLGIEIKNDKNDFRMIRNGFEIDIRLLQKGSKSFTRGLDFCVSIKESGDNEWWDAITLDISADEMCFISNVFLAKLLEIGYFTKGYSNG